MGTLWQDLRFGLRMLVKAPGFTAVAVLTLALGIGANTAMFSVVNTVLLRPFPFKNSAQLVNLWSRSTMFDFPHLGLSLPDIADVQQQNTVFSGIVTYRWGRKMVLSGQGAPQQLTVAQVSEGFFPLLGLQPLYGRLFLPSETESGQDRVVILSHSLWRGELGADRQSIGKRITLDGKLYTIVGVMPALSKLNFPTSMDLWTPLVPTTEQLATREERDTDVLARLRLGRTLAQAQAELETISTRLAKTYPDADRTWSVYAELTSVDLLSNAQTPLLIMLGTVGFVLLIACANVGNLFLSRALSRRRELAIRSSLGATRGHLIRQLLVEGTLLAALGGTCGLLLAFWGIDALRSLVPPNTPRIEELRVDRLVLWFTLGVSIVVGILFGLAPAVLASHHDLNRTMKEGSGDLQAGISGARHNLLRRLLVIGEVALAFVLVTGATLALRSYAGLLDVNLGFRPEHILTMRLDFPPYQFTQAGQSINFVHQALEKVRAIPGVEGASASPFAPFSGWKGETTFKIEGYSQGQSSSNLTAQVNGVAPSYFSTMGIALIAGRDFSDTDTQGAPPTYIVNQTLARKYFSSANPIGKRITFPNYEKESKSVWGEIVGEVGDTRNQSARVAPEPELYRPLYQSAYLPGVSLAVRTNGDPSAVASLIRDRIWLLDKDLPVTEVKTMDQWIAETNAGARFQTSMLGTFGALGLALALVGVYGVISYSVTQRTHEIGIRMALGAQPRDVLRLVLTQGLKLTLIGVAIGIAASVALTRLMASLLFGISAIDLLSFSGVAVLLTLVAVASCYVPARRAMRVDPIVALRYE